LPPLAAGGVLPDTRITVLNGLFVVVALGTMVVVTAKFGFGAAFGALVLLLGAFWLGQRTTRGTDPSNGSP